MTSVSQIIMLYTLNFYSAICQLYLNKTGREKINNLHFICALPSNFARVFSRSIPLLVLLHKSWKQGKTLPKIDTWQRNLIKTCQFCATAWHPWRFLVIVWLLSFLLHLRLHVQDMISCSSHTTCPPRQQHLRARKDTILLGSQQSKF